MARTPSANETVEGRFRHLIYSPKGGVEGVLIETDGAGPRQIVFDRHDDAAGSAFGGLSEGQRLVVEATLLPASTKGPSEHPVHAFVKLRSIDGERPKKPAKRAGAAYVGQVVRFNHARHGAPNGVVLDTGDFIHLRPEGLARLKLKLGDRVEADGDAQYLAVGRGWAVEAVRVNGKAVPRP